jgi:NADPH:quinone reductase
LLGHDPGRIAEPAARQKREALRGRPATATRRTGRSLNFIETHVLVPADTLVRLPPGLDPVEAAGFGLAAVTAYLAIEVLKPRSEQRVLVHGGSSGVGSMAIQMLAAGWNEVIATGTRPEKFEFMRKCGARKVVDTRRPEWSKDLGPIDGVLDLVGHAVFAESVAALSPGGGWSSPAAPRGARCRSRPGTS